MVIDTGDGFDQPIMEKDDFCIFETEDGYVVRQEGEGDVEDFPEDVSDEFWEALRKDGWKDVNYAK